MVRRALAVFGLGLLATSVRAEPRDHARDEAHERFDRGLRLFNQGDAPGALAEFQRAYELVPNPTVLFNVGLVAEAMGDPVHAVEALDRVLRAPGNLGARELARAHEVRDEQAARVGRIALRGNVDGAEVEVDGTTVGRTPLAAPLQVGSGQHIVAVVRPGYAPVRRAVVVAGGVTANVEITLDALPGRLAHLTVRTRIPDAEVTVDDQVIGRTPLPASLALAPGQHAITLKRPGYLTVSQTVPLGDGAEGQITLDPAVDPGAFATAGGSLALVVSEPDAVVFVDGEPRGAVAAALHLPFGKHRLRVERDGFFPFERDVTVPERASAQVAVDLEPTPEKRAAYVGAAKARRTWGFIVTGTGATLAVGSIAYLVWNHGQKSDTESTFNRIAADNTPGSGTRCDPQRTRPASCVEELNIALDHFQSATDRDVWGWVGLGVGAAAAGLGTVLLVTGDDPHRYDPRPESDVFGMLRVVPVGWAAPGGAGAGLRGAF
jgi:hypothetical protein